MSSSDHKSPLLSLPAEIRFMIYREIWTITAEPDSNDEQDIDSDDEQDADSDDEQNIDSDDDEDLEQITQQLDTITALQNLAISCTQIRNELLSEYFTRVLPHTQIHLGNAYRPPRSLFRCRGPGHRPPKISRLALTNHEIFEVLQSSSVFIEHIKHVSLHWGGCLCSKESRWDNPRTPDVLDWLAECEQLKTLELVITDPLHSALAQFSSGWVPDVVGHLEEDEEDVWEDLFCQGCWTKLAEVMMTLEKAVGRLWYPLDEEYTSGRWQTLIVFREHGEWGPMEWFGRERVTAGVVGEDEIDAVGKKAWSYKFENHLGAIDVVWPLFDRI